jgi:hypothetical protein
MIIARMMIILDAWRMLMTRTLHHVMRSGMALLLATLGSRMLLGEAVPVGQAVILPTVVPRLFGAAIAPFVARVMIACGAIVPVMPWIMIPSLLISVAARIVIARTASVPLMGAVVPISVRVVIPIPISRTIIPIPIPRTLVPATVSIAEAVLSVPIPVPNIAPHIFAVAVKPASVLAETAFVATQLAPIFPDIAIPKTAVAIGEAAATGIGTALIQRARAIGDFIGTHALQPVDAIGQLLSAGTLLGPLTDRLAQPIAEAICEWRVTRGAKYATVFQELFGSGSE